MLVEEALVVGIAQQLVRFPFVVVVYLGPPISIVPCKNHKKEQNIHTFNAIDERVKKNQIIIKRKAIQFDVTIEFTAVRMHARSAHFASRPG